MLLFFNTLTFAMVCKDYTEFKQFEGHYYTTTLKKISFEEAKVFAEANKGYLAIPNNARENAFLASLIKRGQYAWIGIHDPNYTQNFCYENGGCAFDTKRFRTIKNGAVTYSNWAQRQPDNLLKENDIINNKEMVYPLGEHWVALAFSGKWADLGNHAGGEIPRKEYAIFEFDIMPACHSSSPESENAVNDINAIFGKCSTWASDDPNYNIDESSGIKTLTCLRDRNNNPFCPANLTPCVDSTETINGTSKRIRERKRAGNTLTLTFHRSHVCYGRKCRGVGSEHIYLNFYLRSFSDVKSFKATHIGADDFAIMYEPNNGHRKLFATADWDTGETYVYNSVPSYKLNRELKYYLRSGRNEVKFYFLTHRQGGWGAVLSLTGDISCNNIRNSSFSCREQPFYEDYTYYQYTCPSGYTPKVSRGNTRTPPPLNCWKTQKVCPYNKNRACVNVDNKLQCSPFPCFLEKDNALIENLGTPIGFNDVNNNGWNADGSCNGQLYVFNGQDNRCRSKDKFGGLVGGGCCDKNKVFLGLVRCKEHEKALAKKNKDNLCVEVGEYCSKRRKFIGCIQHSKTHCCFNSLLAKIFNEQGRAQIGKGWGSPESPNCRGFTTEEFQKLDFSKMNLTEFTKSLSVRVNDSFAKKQSEKIKERIHRNISNAQSK